MRKHTFDGGSIWDVAGATASLPARNDVTAPVSSDDRIPIIAHCHLRWDFVWQRPQHVFSRLAKHHSILVIEEPITAEEEPGLLISEPQHNIVRVVPSLSRRDVGDVDRGCAAVQRLLAPALVEHPLLNGRFEAPVHWFYSPMSAPLMLGRFGAACVVYDCMDELANFRFAPTDIGERERLLLSAADLVFTGGYQLLEAKSKTHANVHFEGCGVDLDHFARARDATTIAPVELSSLPRPLFGYFGVIDERLDYGLLRALAEHFREGSIAMVGPVAKVDAATLPLNDNIHWLGQRSYAQLPELVKAFDVCLMPFALNEATRYINPTKTLEYMAAGKPVVSTAIADVVRNFTPVVAIARSHEQFIDAARHAWLRPDEGLLEQGIARAADASWDSIVARMRGLMLEAVRAAR